MTSRYDTDGAELCDGKDRIAYDQIYRNWN